MRQRVLDLRTYTYIGEEYATSGLLGVWLARRRMVMTSQPLLLEACPWLQFHSEYLAESPYPGRKVIQRTYTSACTAEICMHLPQLRQNIDRDKLLARI